jgi:hypothetical protein
LNLFDDGHPPADLVRAGLTDTSNALKRSQGRDVASGLHEVKELAPSLRRSLVQVGVPASQVRLNHTASIANWNRGTSQVDLVVIGSRGNVNIAVELKVWDIGHQLFDLAKVCCLLSAGAHAAFLICVAKQSSDFGRQAGGELFPAIEGETRVFDFPDLIASRRNEWQRHVGKGGPEPTSVPARVSTTAVVANARITAYPGHSARAIQVAVTDATPIVLRNGWPTSGPRVA